jgi:seryl-tRNA synthetase
MLDLNLIREDSEKVRRALLKRMPKVDFTELLVWDRRRRDLIAQSDDLKARRNQVSTAIPRLKKEGRDVSALLSEMKGVSEKIKELDSQRGGLDESIRSFMESLPNIPADDVPAGGKENNQVIRVFGEKRDFGFPARDHMELAGLLGLVDYERGVKLGGTGFWMYRGKGAVLEWSLINYFVDRHRKAGYEFILPPHLLTYDCVYTAGQFPKFGDDIYMLGGPETADQTQRELRGGSFLLPTAETALANLHRGEILAEEELPKRYFSYTPCYRKEAGSYRTNERGMIRGHQFNKVELFQYALPEQSEKILMEMLEWAESLVKDLGLHYRVSKLAAVDTAVAQAKTYDIEVWLPSLGDYKEVCSASLSGDYQARRGNMRFKRAETGKNEFLHTLNASGLATSRVLPAICEQHQQPDGSVPVPEVLQLYAGFDIMNPVAS